MKLAVVLAGSAFALAGGAAPRGELVSYWDDCGVPAVWVMHPDGSSRVRLTSGANAKRGAFSPDGRSVAFDGGPAGAGFSTNFDIHLVGVDGRGRRSLTRGPARDTGAHWSSDGRRILFTRRAGDAAPASLWVVPVSGGAPRRLRAGSSGVWSPNGRRLAFAGSVGSQAEVFVGPADGRRARRVTRTRAGEYPEAWSPDGRLVLVTRVSASTPTSDVYSLEVATGRMHRLTTALGFDQGAAWAPDGKRILFTSERTGRPRVFVMDADGSDEREIPPRSAGCGETASSWR
jgi:TolB protein